MKTEDLLGQLVALFDDPAAALALAAGAVGSQIVTQATAGVAKLPGRLLKAGFNAGFKTAALKLVRSSRAHRKFEQQWAAAGSRMAQEAAARLLLDADPKLAAQLVELFWQRDYLIAVNAHCEQLAFPIHGSSPGLIDEVFVDLQLRLVGAASLADGADRPMRVSQFVERVLLDLRRDTDIANYLCFGGPGSGKSTLGRVLMASYCEQLLLDPERVGDGSLMLPAYVRAANLVDFSGPFDERLKAVIESELGLSLKSALDTNLLAHRPGGRTRRWLVGIDGLDEITDPQRRLALVHALRRAHLDVSSTFRFFLSCRDTALAQEAFGGSVQILRMDAVTEHDARALFEKYSSAFGHEVRIDSVLHARLRQLKSVLVTPLLVAIASAVLIGAKTTEHTTLLELFEDFCRYLLSTRKFSPRDSQALRAMLAELAEAGDSAPIDRRAVQRSEQLGVIDPELPFPRATQALKDRLVASGLMAVSGDSARFVHASFRLFFLASRFADVHRPGEDSWQLLDPHKNGWDFAQFVMELWGAKGYDLNATCVSLLSYGDEGLRLLSRLLGQLPSLSAELANLAIAKWMHKLEDDRHDESDGAIDNICIIARHHAVALHQLKHIANDTWGLHAAALEAARGLAQLGETAAAHDALIGITHFDYAPDQAAAAAALCEIGYRDKGIQILLEHIESWLPAQNQFMLASVYAIRALHRYGEPEAARHALTKLMSQRDLDSLDAALIGELCTQVLDHASAMTFLRAWLQDHPEIAAPEKILASAERDVDFSDLHDLLQQASAARGSKHKPTRFKRLCERQAHRPEGTARLIEIARNRYVDMREFALDRLAEISEADYRALALELIASPIVHRREKARLASELNKRGLRDEVAKALLCSISQESTPDPWEAELLIKAGAAAEAIPFLERVLTSGVADDAAKAKAIGVLSNYGSSTRALGHFREQVRLRAYGASSFEGMAKALRYTEHGEEIEQLLWRVLRQRAQPMAARLKAAQLLYSPELARSQRAAILSFLKRVAGLTKISEEDRIDAIEQLFDLAPKAAARQCIELAANPYTSFEECMAIAQLLTDWAVNEQSADAVYRAVLDKPLDLHDRIKALHYIQTHYTSIDMPEDLASEAQQELLQIMGDGKVEPLLRFAALAQPGDEETELIFSDDAEWLNRAAVEALLLDQAIPPHLKQECVLRLRHIRPELVSGFDHYLELDSGDIGLQIDCLNALATGDHAQRILTKLSELAQKPTITASNRLRAIQATLAAGETHRAIELAVALAYDAQGEVRLASHDTAKLAEFLLEQRRDQAALELCDKALARYMNDGDDYLAVVGVLACEAFSQQAKAALRTMLATLSPQSPDYARAIVMLENLGEPHQARPARATPEPSVSPSSQTPIERVRALISLRRWHEVRELLAALKTGSDEDRWLLIEACSDLHKTPLQDFAKAELRNHLAPGVDPSDRCRAAEILHTLGDVATARETFIAMAQDPELDSDARLWVANGLLSVNCDEMAHRQLLLLAADADLDADGMDFLRIMQSNYPS